MNDEILSVADLHVRLVTARGSFEPVAGVDITVGRSTTWQRDLLFVGEAAGIDHTTGEGIAQAIAMGRIAAAHLARALRERRTTFHDYDREVRQSIIGRHLLQSAFLAKLVYGRFGRPARRYLLRSDYAREQAMRWYRGEALPMWNQVKLGLGLLAAAR
jgi:flavin-dependent dehydrogenase